MSGAPSSKPPFSTTPQFLFDEIHEPAFDNLTALACKVLNVPLALISIVDANRQYFKSQCGLPEPVASARETPLSHSFCQHVVSHAEPLIIEDARVHPLVLDNLAIRDLGVIAYLGVPLAGEDGVPFGAFCAIDTQPRKWTKRDLDIVASLAAQVMSEVSFRKAAERHRHDMSSLLLAEKDRQSAKLSDRHDLRTPLNALSLSLQLVKELGELSEDQTKYLHIAERNIEEVLKMIDQMLDFDESGSAVAAPLRLAPTSPVALISRAMDQVSSLAAERGHSLATHPGFVPPIEAHAEKIVRVLVNLLANAIKFTPANGHISVSTSSYTTPDGHPAMLFTIEDDGPGIAEAYWEQIFQEGFRIDATAPSRHSTGLGLTFCRRTVEEHRGRIWVLPGQSGGSSFNFFLPLGSSHP